ncbi:4-(cytidine 5'-diphospho)-2-C-methyl-D-erythritol kinase [Candidatus Deianiraea vastatrix]|uniref:4-diphosphocytidyl-2-C-methyl-D-erythritol kinase n=1 Tax=Candidatus Deianiraea vastatrix TaxID=2163644 RepID=A0A5B8XEE2_9RICK|nr:hypothetical protein [Candidatus Deianiraea vastatrix]QED23346.1 4-diphosphocytidyl-2-C-methyl-D-erythritol kinase [Candidatus Deianiraea vastatrix]
MFLNINSYAKLNLFLSIYGLTEDKTRHNISSLMTYVDICDKISITTKRYGDGVSINFGGIFAHKISQYTGNSVENNTIIKTLKLISDEYDLSIDLDIYLEKNIPVASGMGGGSSNAAAMIKFCDKFYGLEMTQDEKINIAREIGADVSFFLQNSSAVCSGIGDVVNPIYFDDAICKKSVLVIDLMEKVSTAKIYSSYDQLNLSQQDEEIMNKNNNLIALSLVNLSKLNKIADMEQLIRLNKMTNNLIQSDKILYKTKNAIAKIAENSSDGLIKFDITGAGSAAYLIYENPLFARRALTNAQTMFPGIFAKITTIMPDLHDSANLQKCGVYQNCA